MKRSLFCAFCVVLLVLTIAAGQVLAQQVSRDDPSEADKQTIGCSNQMSGSGGLVDICRDGTCPPTDSDRRAEAIGWYDLNPLAVYGSPFGITLQQMQGFAAAFDSGRDGVGSLPDGCSSCGAGGDIPAASQLPRAEWNRVWRSTFMHAGSFGTHMYSSYDYYVVKWNNYIQISDPSTGFVQRFIKQGGVYNPVSGIKFRALVTEATATHITIRQPGGRKLRFEITGYVSGAYTQCRIEYIEDIRGNQITFSYVEPVTNTTADVKKWDKITDAYGREIQVSYTVWNSKNVVDQVTLPGGRTVNYTYDASKNQRFPHKISYGGGLESTWTYNFANLTMNEASLSPDHYNWSILLNNAATGRMRHVKRADGNYFFARNDVTAGGINTSTIWREGVVSEIKRSSTAQLISSRNLKLDGTWETDLPYTVGGNYLPQTAYTLPVDGTVPARTFSVVRDAATDKITERSLPDGTTEEYIYNSFNQITDFTDRSGDITQAVYDANGNITKNTVAVGTAQEADEHWTYNAKGQVLTYEDFNGNITTYTYYPAAHASQFELQKITLPTGPGQPAGEINFTYDGFGRVKTTTDPVSRTVTFDYDDMGRHVKTTYADTSTEQTVYDTGDKSARIVKTIDRNGNETQFTYDATGRVETTTVKQAITLAVMTQTTNTYDLTVGVLLSSDTDGDVTEYEYDYLNRIAETTVYPQMGQSLVTENVFDRYRLDHTIDPYGRKRFFLYDNLNRVTETQQELVAGGAMITTKTEYNNDGLVSASIDGNNNRTEFTYDARDRRITTTIAVGSPVQASTSTEYDDNSNVTKRTDERNHDWVSTYSVRDQVLTQANPEGDTTTYTYTPDTLVATVTNANGHVTTNTYEACCARVEKVTDDDGNFKTIEYDFYGNITKTTDESGRVVTFEYDGLQRQTKQTVDPGGLDLITTISYDPSIGTIGESTTTTNPAGQVVTNFVDGIGRTSVVSGDTAKMTYDYDDVIVGGPDNGLLKTTMHTDPGNLDLTSSQLTDGAGRTVKTTDPLGNSATATFDDDNNLLIYTDRDGRVTTNTYDARDRLKTSEGDTGGIAAVTTTVYDDTNNVTSITDAEGKVTQYTYDDANRKLTTTYAFGTADARTWTVAYFPLGQVKKLTKPNGITIDYTYENRELLASRDYNNGMIALGTDTFTYHPNRLLKTAHGGLYNTDLDRSVLNTSYDMANRLIQEQPNIGAGLKTLSYQYTADSLISQTTYPGGTQVQKTYNTNRLPFESKIGGVVQDTCSYDTADRKTGCVKVNGTSTAWTLDANSRTTKLRHFNTGSGVSFQEWDYRYTNADDPLVQDDVTPGLTVHGEAYTYDGLHRLATFNRGTVAGNVVPAPTATQGWTLSKVGDWTAWNDNGTNETRTHNNIHALTTRSTVANPQTYDLNFNQTDDGANYLFIYDANDQLQEVQNRTTMATITEYRYDSQGRRVEKNVGGTITRFYCVGDNVVEERDGADVVTATYTYGDYVDESCTMDRGGQRYYYHCNRMYSTYVLTDAAGAIAERYDYTPYGVVTTFDAAYANPQTTSRVDNPYTYTGRRLDNETLLMYYRARTYDPVQGRFKQLDPIGLSGGLNLYAYVGNGPTKWLDAFGLTRQELNECKSNCLKNHTAWVVTPKLLNCYAMCNRFFDECADMARSLYKHLKVRCNIKDPTFGDCLKEAAQISSAMNETCRNGARPFRPRRPIFNELERGNFCYEWAYGYEDCINNLDPKFFKCKIEYTTPKNPKPGEDYPVHYWLAIDNGISQVYIDDGFMQGFPGYFHTRRPCGGNTYHWPPAAAGVFRRECTPVIARPPWEGIPRHPRQ